jgi:uncharacterized protein (TIGR02452 family)
VKIDRHLGIFLSAMIPMSCFSENLAVNKRTAIKYQQKNLFDSTENLYAKEDVNKWSWKITYGFFISIGFAAFAVCVANNFYQQKNKPQNNPSKPVNDRSALKEIFQDTVRMVEERRKNDIDYASSLHSSRIYCGADCSIKQKGDIELTNENIQRFEKNREGKIFFTHCPSISGTMRVFEHVFRSENEKMKEFAVREFKKTAILNFANFTKAGGGVENGAQAQEEYLCRITDLFSRLILLNDKFYKINEDSGLNTDSRIIYSSQVCQLKADDGELLDKPFGIEFDVITAAAPNNSRHNINEEELKQTIYNVLKLIIIAAIKEECTTIVLGAFGCGVFRNPPKLVGQLFYEILIKEGYANFFDRVIFNIFSAPGRSTENYDSILKSFDGYTVTVV